MLASTQVLQVDIAQEPIYKLIYWNPCDPAVYYAYTNKWAVTWYAVQVIALSMCVGQETAE